MKQAWIIDDDEDMSQALKMMMTLLDFELRIFKDARSGARALLNDAPPNVLLLDLNMPEVSGLDVLDFIRSKPRWANLPVVIFSAESADVTVDDALQRGADAFLCKPVSMAELKEGLARAYLKRQPKAN